MKKLIAIFGVLAFTAGMAFSQNNIADIYQKNDGHIATIEQIGNSNEVYTDQVSYNDEIEVYQDGTENFVDVWQGNTDYVTSSAWNSRAIINQTGSENDALVTQRMWNASNRNRSEIDQEGTNNYAEQDLTNNVRAKIDQKGIDNQAYQFLESNYTLNKGTIFQDGEGNWAQQSQGSTELVAIIHQYGDANIAETDQTNKGNTAQISQGWEIDGWDDLDYYEFQESDGNYAKITQYNNYNLGIIGQFGDSNNAIMNQSGNDNDALIMQNGNSNTATVTQQMAP